MKRLSLLLLATALLAQAPAAVSLFVYIQPRAGDIYQARLVQVDPKSFSLDMSVNPPVLRSLGGSVPFQELRTYTGMPAAPVAPTVTLAAPATELWIYLNGIFQTETIDYTLSADRKVITWTPQALPNYTQSGHLLVIRSR